MGNTKEGLDQESEAKKISTNEFHPYLANHINLLNQTRSKFMPGLRFGDPVWTILLEIFVAEYQDRSTKVDELAVRLDIPKSICDRSITYLLDQSAIFENPNRYTNSVLPLLVSENTKSGICAWLDSCAVEAPQV